MMHERALHCIPPKQSVPGSGKCGRMGQTQKPLKGKDVLSTGRAREGRESFFQNFSLPSPYISFNVKRG
jgi:hypothetical protein